MGLDPLSIGIGVASGVIGNIVTGIIKKQEERFDLLNLLLHSPFFQNVHAEKGP